jgi:D-alanyl-D-alanine carboxypeptidase/D-alanyl-D-alanine-endopeptidase (penicillin-binding protein 4)
LAIFGPLDYFEAMARSSWVLIFLLLCSPLLCRDLHRSPKETLITLQNGIERILLDAGPEVHIGIEIISLKNGEKLYQKSAHHLFVPAACQEMITAAAALHQLGTDFRFETGLFTDGKVEQMTLNGNLYLQGSGDPEFAVRDLEELVFQLKLQGISEITGNLYVDNTLFDGAWRGQGWMADDKGYAKNAPNDALMINQSRIDLWVKPGDNIGEPPFVYQYPKSDFITIENHAETSKEENRLSVKRRSMSKENIIDIAGKISSKTKPEHYSVPIEAPHLYTAHVLQNILVKAGFAFKGKIEAKATPKNAIILGKHISRPLYLIASEMMKTSNSLTANCLFKKIGEKRFGAPGTWQKGSQAIREFLAQTVGINTDKMVIMDGCGLSRYNQISAHQFVTFLNWMHRQFSYCCEFMSSLSTLEMGKVRAKTGAMTGISSISGYLTTDDGEWIAFSILQNGAAEKMPRIDEEICKFLVNFSRKN